MPVAPTPSEATTSVSPKLLLFDTACGVWIVTRMPSSDSQKSIPSVAGSKLVKPSSSITAVGGSTPPWPITVAAGSATPLPSTVTLLETISVSDSPPVNCSSATVPATDSNCPATTLGAVLVNTNTPSEVAALPSPTASWNQNPLVSTAVTTPVAMTDCPT